MFKKLAIIILVLFCFAVIPCFSQEEEVKAEEKEQIKEAEQVKTWTLPSYMLENLKFMQAEFNRTFEAKLNSYKSELISRFEEFKDMPEDAFLVDMEKGIFMERSEYFRLLKEQQLKQQQVLQTEAEKKRPEEGKK